MKTINIPDEMHHALMLLSKEYATQDNCSQAQPMYFTVQTKETIAAPEGCGDHQEYYFDGSTWHKDTTQYEIFDWALEYFGDELPNDWEELEDEDKMDWLKSNGLDIVDVKVVPQYQECFFTKKGCEQHIVRNGHNYSEPVPYANTFWRNTEMELITNLLTLLAKEQNK